MVGIISRVLTCGECVFKYGLDRVIDKELFFLYHCKTISTNKNRQNRLFDSQKIVAKYELSLLQKKQNKTPAGLLIQLL